MEPIKDAKDERLVDGDAVPARWASLYRDSLRAVIAERDALKKTVDMAAILLNRYEERWGPLT